jgi:biotin carboxyl carrier protein
VPEPLPPEVRHPERTAAERSADHAFIDRLSAELLPALIAKLGATGLGELEVREGPWRVRLRRPGDGAATTGSGAARERWTGERERERGGRTGGTGQAGQGGAHALAGLTPVGPGREARDAGGRDAATPGNGREASTRDVALRDGRIVATSPAVGIFQPRPEARAGTKVRAGDKLGSVDMLGIPQEVVAPTDGLVGATLVEPGDAVEYGQELILIEFPSASAPPAEA